MKSNFPATLRSLCGALFIACTAVGHAAVVCEGKVVTLALGPQSSVLQVSNGHGVHYLCSFTTAMNGVPVETCKAWYALLLSAKLTGKQVAQYYSTTTSCATLGSWRVPTEMPYFVDLKD